MPCFKLLCVALLLWQLSTFTSGNSDTPEGPLFKDADRLLRNLKSTYNKYIRPVYKLWDPVNIEIYMFLVSIQDFDEVSETLKTALGVTFTWNDPGMRWNFSDYGGLKWVTLRNNDFLWTPPLALTNSVESITDISADKICPVTLLSDGTVMYSLGSLQSSSCAVDITFYPFDIQTCSLLFVAWGYAPSQINFTSQIDSLGLIYYFPSGTWTLLDSKADVQRFNATYTLRLERKPHYVILNIISPLIAIAELNLIVFFIPVESGERIAYCLTILLFQAVFLTLISDTLPKTSNTTSWFSYCLLCNILISIVVTVTVICNLTIFHTNKKKKPGKFWIWFSAFMSCKPCRNVNIKDLAYTSIHSETNSEEHDIELPRNRKQNGNKPAPFVICETKEQHSVYKCQKLQNGHLNEAAKGSGNDLESSEVKVNWKEVSHKMDMICFWFFLGLHICNYTVFVLKVIYRL